jgi:hypothetical protein|nr:MAG TPA: nucleotide kinase [Caudoviricetes sp.]
MKVKCICNSFNTSIKVGNVYPVIEVHDCSYTIINEIGVKCVYDKNLFEVVEPLEGVPSMVEHPQHYNKGKYEVIDVINDWGLNFDLGNVVKYIARAEHKGNKLEDLEKALFYLQYEVDRLKGRFDE